MPGTRPFKTNLPQAFLETYQAGSLRYAYRGVPCLQNPLDMAIFTRALWDLQPRTLIEIGSKKGGSALWFADLLGAYGLETPVYSIDLAPPDLSDPRITFLEGNVNDLEPLLAAQGLLEAPHPWFVLEDSAHTFESCLAALHVFGRHMQTGDLMVMQDGVLDELGLTERYQGGPSRAIAAFLDEAPDIFEIDTALCDMFGPNATFAPNGYLRRR